MLKIKQLLLSSILIATFTVSAKQVVSDLFISSLAASPFHPDIKIASSDEKKYRVEGNVKNFSNEAYTKTTEISWTNYASSWAQFKRYYKTITIYGSGYATGKEAGKKAFTNVNISVASLEQRTTWHDSGTLRASGSKWCLAYSFHQFGGGSIDEAGVYYDAIVSGSLIKLRLQVWIKAHQVGWGSIWTESQVQYNGGIINSSWNLNSVKASLNTALANKIELASDYSGSLQDKNNIIDPTGKGNDETTLINSVIAKVLGDEYHDWKKYIQPFTFSDATSEATITIKFEDPATKEQQVWVFHTPIKITLSEGYWGKELRERLHIKPGLIVNPEDSTKGMIEDRGMQLEQDKITDNYGGTMQYHTTADIEFDAAEDSNEWMTVNGERVEVLNNKFLYHMVDYRVDQGQAATNVYDVIVYREDTSGPKTQYQIKYVINNLVPTLSEKWYAWAPEKTPEQKKLIEPILANGQPNPDYDQEINRDTGTKTQIIWVKKKSQYPFPLDPLNKNGEVIDSDRNVEAYDLGFIAEGSVVGKGVQQLFESDQVASVAREGVDHALKQFANPDDKQQMTEIVSDSENKYWSWQGMWHYITRTTDGLAYEKYALIGPKYDGKYPRFLDVLADSSIAIDFWTTIHGVHLKNFLAAYKGLDSKAIAELSYEQVVSYWKEYTSGIINQTIPPDPNPASKKDLSSIDFDTIKMNLTDIELIKAEIKKQVRQQLTKYGAKALIYDEDYELKPFDNESVKKLLDYDNEGNATVTLSINALATSVNAIGTKEISIRNNIHYDPDQVFDLAKINPWSYTQNFSQLTINQLKDNWILGAIKARLANAKVVLDYQSDYDVKPLDEEGLQQFIDAKEVTHLKIMIAATDESLKAINHTTLALTNDPDGEIAPPIPPDPDPNPNPIPPNNWTKTEGLIIMSIIVVGLVSGTGILVFLKFHLKRGIGGKKVKIINKK